MADGRQILEIVMGGSGGAGGGVADGGASGGSNPLSSIAKKLGVSQENQKDTANATQGMAKGFLLVLLIFLNNHRFLLALSVVFSRFSAH